MHKCVCVCVCSTPAKLLGAGRTNMKLGTIDLHPGVSVTLAFVAS